MKKLKFLLFMCGLFFAGKIFAEENQPVNKINLEQAVECALQNNTSVKQAAISLNQVKRDYRHSWNNFLPSVNVSASGTESQGFSSDTQNTNLLSTGISASLSFTAGLGEKLKSIKESYENGQLDYIDSVNEIKASVTTSFYSILYMEKQVELSRESLNTSLEQYRQIETKKRNGLVPEIDLFQSQLNAETAKVNLKNTEKNYVNNLLTFLNDIGYVLNENEKVSLEGSLDECDSYLDFTVEAEKLDALVEKSPTLRSLRASLSETESSLKQMKLNTYVPSLTLSANVNPYTDTYVKLTDSSSTSDSWSATIAFSYALDRLVPGSSSADSIKDLSDSVESLRLTYADTKKSLKTSALEMINTIEIAKETLENYRQNVEIAKKTYDLALIAYKNGSKEYTALKNVQDSYESAKLQLNNQQLSIISSVIQLQNLLGLIK